MLNYVNFENLKTNIEYNVIFNIDNTNIKVPPLSIVTLVENAVKHSKIETKNDGYIEISTSIEDGKFVISIADNGVGFDVNSISENSCGIKNTKDRFALLLNGELEIFSKINCGIKILIKIPFGEEYERISD
ncbi:MAG: ATP-binding protein [Candidatus Onthovivens sp.]